jgi:hypothetical protein
MLVGASEQIPARCTDFVDEHCANEEILQAKIRTSMLPMSAHAADVTTYMTLEPAVGSVSKIKRTPVGAPDDSH